MRQYGEIEQQKRALLKAARSAIRLKHSLAADEEINQRLPEIERDIDRAIQQGQVFELDVQSILQS